VARKRKTPYEVLGVGKDADKETLKRAYRKRSRETHPDRGGSNEEFREVSTAFAVLSDPERRRRYEETGDESERIVDSWRKVLAGEFVAVVQEVVTSGKADTSDLVEQVRRRLRTKCQEAENSLNNMKRAEDGLRSVIKRLKDPKGLLVSVLDGQLAGLVEDRGRVTVIKEDLYAALKYVEDCRYVFEKPPVPKFNTPWINFSQMDEIFRRADANDT